MTECKKPEFDQGERAVLFIGLNNKEDPGTPIDLSGVEEIQIPLKVQLESNGGFLVKLLERTAQEQITEITTLADSGGSLNEKSFKFFTPSNNYRFYFDNGTANDPSDSNEIGVSVPFSDNDDEDANAISLQLSMNSKPDITATVSLDTVTAISEIGKTKDAIDFDSSFLFVITQKGYSTISDSVSVVPGTSQIKLVLTPAETSALNSGTCEELPIIIDFPSGHPLEGRKIFRKENAFVVNKSEFLSYLDK